MYRMIYLILNSVLIWSCHQKKTDVDALPYYNEPSFTPVFETDTIENKITHQIGNFSFLNHDSLLIDQTMIEGKIHVANFIFTTCGVICPRMTSNLKKVSDSLLNMDDLVFMSFSVTPWIDNPSVLNKYRQLNLITNPNWHFLTGNKADIYKLARQSYFAEEEIGFNKDSTEFLHTEHFILADKKKRIRGIYNGTLALEMQQLITDIRVLKEETEK